MSDLQVQTKYVCVFPLADTHVLADCPGRSISRDLSHEDSHPFPKELCVCFSLSGFFMHLKHV